MLLIDLFFLPFSICQVPSLLQDEVMCRSSLKPFLISLNVMIKMYEQWSSALIKEGEQKEIQKKRGWRLITVNMFEKVIRNQTINCLPKMPIIHEN